MTNKQNKTSPLGLNAYKEKVYGASSKEEILLSLNMGIYEFLKAAKFSYEQNSLDKMFLFNKKAVQIILSLKGHFSILETEKTGTILQDYYSWLFNKVLLIHKVIDTPREFDNLLSTIDNFCKSLEAAIPPHQHRQNLPTRINTVI